MLQLNIDNLFSVGAHGLTQKQFSAKATQLAKLQKKIYQRERGFYTVVDDKQTIKDIAAFAKKVQGKYRDIVVLGIGGSALGAICLRDALTHSYRDLHASKKTPRLHVLDNIDPAWMTELEDVIDLKQTLFIVISKSGRSTETLAQYFYFRKQIDNKKLNPKNHFVWITNPDTGLLHEQAEREGVQVFEIAHNVSGRFSVLTAVGLLPAALLGIDIDKLMRGANSMTNAFFSQSFEKNLPFQLATILYQMQKKGKNIHVMMPYAQKLFRFADWYRQLLAESIGKKKNERGKVVQAGITPVRALGVTDQHSQSQLYNEGPNDKLITFIAVKKLAKQKRIPNLYPHSEHVDYLKNTSFNELMDIERHATTQSLTENKRPNMTIHIDRIDEHHLGQLFVLCEGAIAFLGEMLKINAFNQPGVERSKTLTREWLRNKK